MRFVICLFLLAICLIYFNRTSIFSASTLKLDVPLECDIPGKCTLQNYFDRDPSPEAHDYTCGNLSYDGHKGTDIRVPNLAVLDKGIWVVAAAPGKVRAIRNDMEDINIREIGLKALKGKEAGNSVVLVHPGGWETQYAHMKKGSIIVKPGDEVKAGQRLGFMGLSGNTEFPHLHFEVRLKGQAIDPFVGITEKSGCGAKGESLWSDSAKAKLKYISTGLLNSGFSTAPLKKIPNIAPETYQREATLPANAPALVFWSMIYGIQSGDEEIIRLLAPSGETLAEKRAVSPKNQAQYFSYVGKKRKEEIWEKGIYTGEYSLKRDGQVILSVKRNFKIQ